MEAQMSHHDFESFCTKLWEIWKDRCNLAHKPQGLSNRGTSSQMGQWTDNFLYEFCKVQRRVQNKGLPLVERYSHTQDGENNKYLSIYVDAAFCDVAYSYATTFAIYDPWGGLVVVGYCKI